jgi:hypothetical protein
MRLGLFVCGLALTACDNTLGVAFSNIRGLAIGTSGSALTAGAIGHVLCAGLPRGPRDAQRGPRAVGEHGRRRGHRQWKHVAPTGGRRGHPPAHHPSFRRGRARELRRERGRGTVIRVYPKSGAPVFVTARNQSCVYPGPVGSRDYYLALGWSDKSTVDRVAGGETGTYAEPVNVWSTGPSVWDHCGIVHRSPDRLIVKASTELLEVVNPAGRGLLRRDAPVRRSPRGRHPPQRQARGLRADAVPAGDRHARAHQLIH